MSSLLTENEYRRLKGIYTSLDSVAAFGGVNDLVRESGLSVKQVKEFLQSSKTYTKFRPNRKRFKRLRVHSLGINHVWSVDLAHMDKLAAENDGYQYMLVCVDTFSRFLRVQPMKDKQSETALVALKKMLPKARADYPLKIWVDQGKEFCGAFKNFCLQNDIVLYNTFNDSKSGIAERYIRTIKSKLYKYFNERQTTRYIGQLQKLVKILNSRSHPILGMAPKNVRPEHTVDLLKKNVPDMLRKWRPRKTSRKFCKKKPKFKKGQTVRISRISKSAFDKGYTQNFTDEIFKVASVSRPLRNDNKKDTRPITYSLVDGAGEKIIGRFYEPELVAYRYE